MTEKKHYFLVGGLKVHWDFKLLPTGFNSITLFGHIYNVRSKEDLRSYLKTNSGKQTINHERIHMLQAESFKFKYLTFYILYIWYWFIGLFKHGCKNDESYNHIPFEREAYAHENDFEYNETHWKDYRNK